MSTYTIRVADSIISYSLAGGFGFVFKVRDIESQEVFALKRLIAADKESKEEIENEIQFLIKLQPHPHVMKFISWGLINQNIYLLLRYVYGKVRLVWFYQLICSVK